MDHETPTSTHPAGSARAPAGRRLPIGAECTATGVHFRVHASRRTSVQVVVESGPGAPAEIELAADDGGYFGGEVSGAGVGTRYRYRLDGADAFPDPASRFQPEGPHAASEVVDPSTFAWTDHAWAGPEREGQIMYELHIGTFTPEGDWTAATRALDDLSALGVTVVELMPIAEFTGRFGWGYDGVQLFAPFHHYGTPDDARRFIDRAHALGMAVILDVVYNHFGPDGNYLGQYNATIDAPHSTDWGTALNYDGPGSEGLRTYVLSNVRHWIDEYHFDGLRLDATQDIHDTSPHHLVACIAEEVAAAAHGRRTLVVVENEPQDAKLLRSPERGGYGADMAWNDDFHHAAIAAATGNREAYARDYLGTAREFVAMAKFGFLYQGQYYAWQRGRRGTSALDLAPSQFVTFLENHDQVANGVRGLRLHQRTSPGRWRALTTFLLLGPGTPLLFMGQEFATTSRWVFFADHAGDLAEQVRAGRTRFLSQFPSIATEGHVLVPDPSSSETLAQCVLDPAERARNVEALTLHRDLIALRRGDRRLTHPAPRSIDGAPLSDQAFCLRWLSDVGDDRLLVVNLGATLPLEAMGEPLIAPPAGTRWRVVFSSERPTYGGGGTPALVPEEDGPWTLPAECALFLKPVPYDASNAG